MAPTRFSIQINPYSDLPEDDEELIKGIIDDGLYADAAGMAAIYITEHHGTHPGNAFMLASYLAAKVTQAHVGFCICVVPLHHPARLAEMATLLDHLSEGRFVFGIGGGGLPLEFAHFGVHAADSTQLHDEVFDAVMTLWNKKPEDPPVEISAGPYTGTVIKRSVPSPYRGRVPHVKLAAASPSRQDKAARYGWSIFSQAAMIPGYRALLEGYGHPQEVIDRAMAWSSATEIVHVAPTDDEARQAAIDGMAMRSSTLSQDVPLAAEALPWMRQRAMPGGGGPGGPGGPPPGGPAGGPPPGGPPPGGPGGPAGGPPPGGPGGPGGMPSTEEMALRFSVWGSPETVIEKLRDKVDMGVPEISVGFDNGAMNRELRGRMHASVRLFCDEVLPFFKTYEPDLERGKELLANDPMLAMMRARAQEQPAPSAGGPAIIG